MPDTIDAPVEAVDGPVVVRRIISRLIPFLCLLFIVNYLDRTNVAMAKLRMLSDTGMDDAAYGLGAGLFFIGYFIFEVPSNLLLERIGARRWIARIMVTWGAVSAAMMFVQGPISFYVMRFLLGVAEAGFFPGIVLYLTYWVPSDKRAKVLAAFLTSTALSGVIGSPLAGALMKLEGVAGLHGWQWLFLLEGLAPVALGFVVLLVLPDKPADARWLTTAEKAWIEAELHRDASEAQHHTVAQLGHALRDARLWLLSAIYFLLIMGLYGFVYWSPTIVKQAMEYGQGTPEASDLAVGIWSALPFTVAAVSMVLIGEHSDRRGEHRWHVTCCAMLAAGGVALLTRCHEVVTVLPVLSLAAVGIFGSLGPFWALATRFLRGSAAAGGIAIVNSIGALAGFVAPWLIGLAKRSTGSYANGLMVVSASLVCGGLLVLCVHAGAGRAGVHADAGHR